MSLNLFELDLYKVIAADMHKVKYQDVTAGQRAQAKTYYYTYLYTDFYTDIVFGELLPPLFLSVFREELQEMGVTADELVAYYTEKLRAPMPDEYIYDVHHVARDCDRSWVAAAFQATMKGGVDDE